MSTANTRYWCATPFGSFGSVNVVPAIVTTYCPSR